MSSVTQPRGGIPIATVTIAGQRYECATNPEFVRFFETLIQRVGGPVGTGTDDLALSQFEDAGIEELKAGAYQLADAFGQVPVIQPTSSQDEPSGELSALREELAAMKAQINELMIRGAP